MRIGRLLPLAATKRRPKRRHRHAAWVVYCVCVLVLQVHCIDGWEGGCDGAGCSGRWQPKAGGEGMAGSLIFAASGFDGARIPIFNDLGGVVLRVSPRHPKTPTAPYPSWPDTPTLYPGPTPQPYPGPAPYRHPNPILARHPNPISPTAAVSLATH
jgi:hypothetical protein